MSENEVTPTAEAGDNNTEDSSFKAPATQEDLDRIVQARLAKERAKYSDYDELKSAAQKLRDIEDANKTELEKAIARAEAAEQKLSESALTTLKLKVASKHGLDQEDIDLFLTGTDEELLEKQAERLAARKPESTDEDKRESTRIGFGVDLKDRKDEDEASSKDELARSMFGY